MTPRVWRLRSHLSALLVMTMLLTFALVGTGLLAYRIPAIERETQRFLQRQVGELAGRLELMLGTAQSRVELLQSLVVTTGGGQAGELLEEGLHSVLRFDAVYRVAGDGRVLAAGLAEPWRDRRAALMAADLSGNGLFQAASRGRSVVWSGSYVSAVSGDRAVGLAVRDAQGRVLIAEIASGALVRAVKVAAGRRAAAVWVVDRHGDVIVDTQGREDGRLNIRDWPLLQPTRPGGAGADAFEHGGIARHAATAHSDALDWTLVAHAPTGWDNPAVSRLVSYVGASFAGCLLVGLLIAPLWAQRLVRPLQRIVERAAATTRGDGGTAPWPRGPVEEFNQLSQDLQDMAHALQEREHKFHAIFNASPVPMSVTDAADGYRLLDVNEAWCRELRRTREQALGRTALEIGLWSVAQRNLLLAQMQGQRASGETELLRGDGEPMQAQVFAQRVVLASQDLMMWAVVDMGPLRRSEQQLRDLNLQLEERVAQRSDALAASNAELTATVQQLRTAQNDLVRTEKMAALGGLVAGVAHELNTPLGNGVMALSAMADATRRFRDAMAAGLRRRDLQEVLDSVSQGTDIAQRNLRRAADLVHSFKQVAVDRASAQRRSFELAEVVHEMVMSLRPSFARTPYRIEVDVPAQGLRLDSDPGALGQVIGNLIQNAVLHGFDGRAHGTVRITAGRDDMQPERPLWLRVADDGRGIAAGHIDRIFEPFMTTRAGRGGTGLGLHVSQNAVANLLGGTLSVQSVHGEGATFVLRLPVRAPTPPGPPGGHAASSAA